MANLHIEYAGLKLRNPFIISSSGLTSSIDRIRKLDSLGAGAIVLKSLFEEQIRFESGKLTEGSDYPEAYDYVRNYTRENSVGEYLNLIKEAKRAVHIPIIASINCVSVGEWIDFAKRIEEAGADALELNVYYLPNDKNKESLEYERIYFDILSEIKDKINIPVIFKIGAQFTNPTSLVNQLYYRKADAVVMFNRFYAPDIDLENMDFSSADVLSSPSDLRTTLRWIGIVSSEVSKLHIATSTGIHSGEAAIKVLLAGAQAVQVCSVLYKNGMEYLTEMIDKLESWMLRNNYKTVKEFRGRMNYGNIEDPSVYERAQFMKYFSNLH
ncbi:MAG: dihydroorotate dehydrogenase-like protein [Bacteroidales bacterium]